MIEELLLKNFQTHEKLKIVFDPMVTVIVGKTDSGKSSVIRALRWVLLNQPRGAAFVRHGETGSGVRVKIDGEVITRGKEGDQNTYSIGDSSWTAFGTTIPEKITKFTQIDELNFQQQHDSPFWLSLSAGEVSRRLNAIVDLEIIDKVSSGIKSKLQDQKRQVELNLNKLRIEKESLESNAWVAKAEIDYRSLVGREEEIGNQSKSQNGLLKLIQEISELCKVLDRKVVALETLTPIGRRGADCLDQSAKVQNLYQSLEECVRVKKVADFDPPSTMALTLAFEDTETLRTKTKELRNSLDALKVIRMIAKRSIEIPDFDEIVNNYRDGKSRADSLGKLASGIKTERSKVRDFKDPEPMFALAENCVDLGKKTTNLEDTLKTAKALTEHIIKLVHAYNKAADEIVQKTKGLCPTCGGPLK